MDTNQDYYFPQSAFPSHVSGLVIAGTYRLLERLGEGSSCTVYKVEDLRNDSVYAAKIECIGQLPQSLEHEYGIYRILHDRENIAGIPQSVSLRKRQHLLRRYHGTSRSSPT